MVKKFYLKRFVAVFMFFVVLTTSIIVPVQKAKAFAVVDDAAAYVLIAAIATACGYEVATSGVGEQITDAILNTDLGRSAWDSLKPEVQLGVGGAYIISSIAKSKVTDMANAVKAYFGDTAGEKTVSSNFNTADFSQMYDYGALLGDVNNFWVGNVPINIVSTTSFSFDSMFLGNSYSGSFTRYNNDFSLTTTSFSGALGASDLANNCYFKLHIYNNYFHGFKVYKYAADGTKILPAVFDSFKFDTLAWNCNEFNLHSTTISNFMFQEQVLYSIDQLLESRFNDFLNALGELDDIIVRPVSGVSDYTAPDTIFDDDVNAGVIGVAVPSDYVGTDDPAVDIPTTGTVDLTAVENGITGVNSRVDTLTDTVADLPTATIGTGGLDFSGFIGITLKDVFPFCIPFDLVDCVSQLVAEPKAPCFTVDFSGTAMASAGTVTLDLARFEGLAKIVRYFVFLGFIVGLIMITRNLIRG